MSTNHLPLYATDDYDDYDDGVAWDAAREGFTSAVHYWEVYLHGQNAPDESYSWLLVRGRNVGWRTTAGYDIERYRHAGDLHRYLTNDGRIGDYTLTLTYDPANPDDLYIRRTSHDEPCGASFIATLITDDAAAALDGYLA
jgi:hypothetical protein